MIVFVVIFHGKRRQSACPQMNLFDSYFYHLAILVVARHVGYDTKGEPINIILMLEWRLFVSIFIKILLLELVAVFLRNYEINGFINESRLNREKHEIEFSNFHHMCNFSSNWVSRLIVS